MLAVDQKKGGNVMRQDKRQEVLRAALERLNRTDTRYACAAHFERYDAVSYLSVQRYFAAFVFAISLGLPELAAGASHCTADEVQFWSCSAKGKVYELCASRDLGKGTGYLQYRAGRLGKVELVFPSERSNPLGVFSYRLFNRHASLSFNIGEYQYELIDKLIGRSEINVLKSSRGSVPTLTCERSTQTLTDTATIDLFKIVGLYD